MREAPLSEPEFAPYGRSSPFLDLIGPLLTREFDGRTQFAIQLDHRHVNAREGIHGGVLATLADVALGYAAAFSSDPPTPLSTASLTIDFAGRVQPGDLLLADVDVQRVGRRLAFANCFLTCGERRVARASAVFAVTGARA